MYRKIFIKTSIFSGRRRQMAYPVIIRNAFGYLSYLVLDDHPRELLRHPGFQEE
jgi:hypothetical protein